MPKVFGVVLVMAMLCATQVCAQERPAGFPSKLTVVPAALPVGCSAALVAEINGTTGTPSYRSAHREIASLKLGHSASQELQAALSRQGNAGDNLLHEVIPIMSGLTEAQNTYLCASFVAGQKIDEEESQRAEVEALISVYNRMALQTLQLENVLSSEVAAVQAGKGRSQAKTDGQAAAILEDRKEAGSDLVDVVTKDETLMIDTDGPGGAKADWLRITCAERGRLLSELVPLAKSATVDEFTVAASLIEDFLEGPHKCIA